MTREKINNEKAEKDYTLIAVLVLLIIVASSLLLYIYVIYNPIRVVIEEGDCVDINYIGRYASNNTIFDSSYKDVYNKTYGTPIHVFVSFNKSATPPKNYSEYSSNYITGLLEGLIGLKEGETTIIGPIPPSKAYGEKLKEGDRFLSSNFAPKLNMTVEVTNITSDNSISVRWVNPEDLDYFTPPNFVIISYEELLAGNLNKSLKILPPYHLWGNSTRVINISDEEVIIQVTPTKNEHIVENITPYYVNVDTMEYVFPDATIATWDDTNITLTSNPKVGERYKLSYNYFGLNITTVFTIINVTDDKINISVYDSYSNETMYQEFNRSRTFTRVFALPRYYRNIPNTMINYLYLQDIQNAGYSIDKLAGESLIFEVTVERIHKIK